MLVVGTSLRPAQVFGLPGLPQTGVSFFPHEGQVELLYGEGHTQQVVRVAAEPLGAMLVSYCIRARIPMPLRADKRIRIEADAVILFFRTIWAKAPTPKTSDKPTPVNTPRT